MCLLMIFGQIMIVIRLRADPTYLDRVPHCISKYALNVTLLTQ